MLAEDGTVELPEGAVTVSVVFESEGPFGQDTKPAAVWVELPHDA